MKLLQHTFETSETLKTYICSIRFQRNISLLRSRIAVGTAFLVGNCGSGSTSAAAHCSGGRGTACSGGGQAQQGGVGSAGDGAQRGMGRAAGEGVRRSGMGGVLTPASKHYRKI